MSPLAALLAVRRPRGLPVFVASVRRDYVAAMGRRIPARMPVEEFGRDQVVSVRIGENGQHGSMVHLLLMSMVAMLKPRRVFEIGTHTGGTTALVAMNTSQDTEIFTLDLSPDETLPEGVTDLEHIARAREALGKAFRNTEWEGEKIQQLLGNSKTFDFSPYHDSIDFVIVDASHSHEFVFNDSMRAFRMIRPGGVILWHDYESMRSEYGVTKFCNRLRHHYGFPVFRLGAHGDDTRYAWMRVDAATCEKVKRIAANPASF